MSFRPYESFEEHAAVARYAPARRPPARPAARTRRSAERLPLARLQTHARQGGAQLVPLRLFIGLGWLRAGMEKLADPGWADGSTLSAFLAERLRHDAVAFPLYERLIGDLFLPHAAALSVIVLLGQVLAGVAIFGGCLTNAALLGGIFMNLNFLLAGQPNPSAFYLVIQATLLLAGTGAVFGLDAKLATAIGTPLLVARPRSAGSGWQLPPRALAVACLVWLGMVGYALAHVADWSPAGSIGDPAMLVAVLAGLAAVWTALAWLRRGAGEDARGPEIRPTPNAGRAAPAQAGRARPSVLPFPALRAGRAGRNLEAAPREPIVDMDSVSARF